MREKIGHGSLGNGYSVWDSDREEKGDYRKLAHIGRDREVTYWAAVSNEAREYIETIARYHNGPAASGSERTVLEPFGGSGFMSLEEKTLYLRTLGCNESGIQRYANELWDADREPYENIPLFRKWWEECLANEGWVCTDPDTGQWARKIDDFTWDYFDNGDGPEDATRVCVKEFKISTIESTIACYGYTMRPDSDRNIQTIYGDSYLQVIAECLFEKDA